MHDDLTGALLATTADDAGAIRFRQPRDFGDTINITFRFIRENARELGKGLLFLAGPFVLLGGIGSFFAQRQMLDLATGAGAGTDPFEVFRTMASPAYLFTILIGMIAPFVVMAVTLAYVRLYQQGEAGQITPGRLWEAARGHIGPLLRAYLLVFVVFLLGAVVNLIPCLGTLAYLGGAVYAFPIVALMFVARTAGAGSAQEAFQQARALVRGHWGQTFGVIFIAWMLIAIAALAIGMVTSVPTAILSATSPGEAEGVMRTFVAVGALLGMVVSFAYALPFIAHAFQYYNLVERHEGAGLGSEVAALATRPARRDDAPERTFVERPRPAASSDVSPSEAPVPPPPGASPAPLPSTPARGFRGGGFDADDASRP